MQEIIEDLRAVIMFLAHAVQAYVNTPAGMAELQAVIGEIKDDFPGQPDYESEHDGQAFAAEFDPSTVSRQEFLKKREGK